MDNNGGNFSKILTALAVSLAATIPVFTELYSHNREFKWAVDQSVSNLAYRLQMARWRAKVWNRLLPYQQEIYEQKHGHPER